MQNTELYLAVLPLVHLGASFPGVAEQALTLLPHKDFATAFFADEVDDYVSMFQGRANKYFTGGHVTGYRFSKEQTEDGRFIVRVIQDVR